MNSNTEHCFENWHRADPQTWSLESSAIQTGCINHHSPNCEFRVDDIHVKFVHSLRFIACKLSQSQRNGQRMHFKAKLSQQWLKWVLIYSVCIEPYSNLYCHICSIKRHSEVSFRPECRFEYMSLYFGAQLRGFCICA